MNAVTFDTLRFVETLEQAKLPREQASAIATAVRDAHVSVDVATKDDIDALETRTDSKFELLRKDMDAKFALLRKDMDTMRKDIIIKMGGMFIVAVGIIVSVLFRLLG